MPKNAGGPAFPIAFVPIHGADAGIMVQHDGATLRDLFAAFALVQIADPNVTCSAETVAKSCYQFADAMIAEREKE